MADEDLNRPYVGYRRAGRRPESQQDRRASADAPLAALRGFLSGVVGAPGDLESLVRMLPGLSERTILPTSEDVERRLPLRSVSETPVGRLATTGGQLAGGFYNGPGSPLRALAALPSAVSRAGREFLQSGVPAHVIKPKGGNWLTGSVEEAIKPLKQRMDPELEGYARRGQNLMPHEAADVLPKVAINDWLDTKLGKYMRNEMGTPEDPIRALAEQGIIHQRPVIESPTRYAITNRESAGYPSEGVAQSELARLWENATDSAILPRTAGQQLMAEYPHNAETMPWLAKVPPDTPVYTMTSMDPLVENLGFGHLRDELRNALNPESGLPANLLLTPEQLGRVSTPQAVELVHKINEYRAAEKAAADAARAQNAATVLHKEYPEAGYRWMELKAPGGWPEGEARMSAKDKYGDLGRYARSALEDALKYEGDVMGHCVGGYCPDVMEGRSRIFSLRSAKGEPHVTIEVAPSRESAYDYWYGLNKGTPEAEEFQNWAFKNPNKPEGGLDAWYPAWAKETGREVLQPPASIVQIKGKQNRAPKEEYLPFVQDFVRSQNWRDVGDLSNTGLVDMSRYPDAPDYLKSGPRFITQQEYDDAVRRLINERGGQSGGQGFASGGLVTYNPAEVDDLTNQLRAELGLQ